MTYTITGSQPEPSDAAAVEAAESAAWDEMEATDAAAAGTEEDRNLDEGADNNDQTNNDGSEAVTGNPAESPGGALDAQPGANQPGGQGPQTTPDPWANAPEGLRNEHDTLKRRLSGQDRTIRQLNARLLASSGTPGPGAKPGTGGDASKPDPAKGSLGDDPEWRRIEDEYPDIAKPLRAAVEASNANLETVSIKIAAMEAGEHEALLSYNEQALLETHPDFVSVVKSQEFADWSQGLSPSLQVILRENAKSVVDLVGATAIVDLFKAQTAGAAAGAAQAGSGQGTGSNLSGKRERQLEAAQAAHRGGGPRIVDGTPPDNMTEEEAWAFYERQDSHKRRA